MAVGRPALRRSVVDSGDAHDLVGPDPDDLECVGLDRIGACATHRRSCGLPRFRGALRQRVPGSQRARKPEDELGRHGGDARRPGLLARRLRRRHLHLRRRRLLRLDRRHQPQQADRRHGGDARRPGLLARRLRRRHLHLRRRRLLRLDRRHQPQQADRRHGGDARRAGLLARRLRRRHLHLR